MAVCLHESLLEPGKLSAPTAFTKIFKDECCLCFKTAQSDDGLLVCLSCFHGGCPEHAHLHFSKTGHPLALRLKKMVEQTEKPIKICRVEVKEEDEIPCTFTTSIDCLSCRSQIPEGHLKVKAPHLHTFFYIFCRS